MLCPKNRTAPKAKTSGADGMKKSTDGYHNILAAKSYAVLVDCMDALAAQLLQT